MTLGPHLGASGEDMLKWWEVHEDEELVGGVIGVCVMLVFLCLLGGVVMKVRRRGTVEEGNDDTNVDDNDAMSNGGSSSSNGVTKRNGNVKNES